MAMLDVLPLRSVNAASTARHVTGSGAVDFRLEDLHRPQDAESLGRYPVAPLHTSTSPRFLDRRDPFLVHVCNGLPRSLGQLNPRILRA